MMTVVLPESCGFGVDLTLILSGGGGGRNAQILHSDNCSSRIRKSIFFCYNKLKSLYFLKLPACVLF